ncbi:DUF2283 domain-containing protein [Micromonospora sp. CA-263727]|uniref:DUF2283 domain-containing protein n=1 Tax=Micromonospora sp. CA-263727 TaxID=3239967 RepID=UPI003D939E49
MNKDEPRVCRLPLEVSIDPAADAAYFKFVDIRPGGAVRQVQVEGIPSPAEINLDFDARGHLLGMEVIGVSVVFPDEVIDGMT